MMNSFADGGSSRVSIPDHLRKTLNNIREITGKQHSDEDIFAVYKDSFNDPHETAQKLLFLDTFHEVRSKKEKRKENVVPVTQGSARTGRRNFASGNGRRASFKKDSGANHVTGGSRTALPVTNKARNITAPHEMKVSGPTSLPSGVSNHKVQDDFTVTVNEGLAEKNHLSKSTSSSNNSIALVAAPVKASQAISEPVDIPVSVSLVQNIRDVTSSQVLQPVVKNQPAELQSSISPDPSSIFASRCSSHSDQVTEIEAASNKSRTQSLLKSDVSEKSHVTFPSHLQVDKVLHNGLTFGSFDYNSSKEASPNSGASRGDDSDFESSHMTGDDEGESSPTTSAIPGVASAREETPVLSEDKDYKISNSAPEAELLGHSEEALSNGQIAYGQEAPLNVFGLVPSFPALGQPVNTEAAETQLGNSNAPAMPLVSYPPDQSSMAAASQQATHLFRQQYPPNFFPYGPYYPPFYMPPPYMHQFLSHPQQPYYPPGAALAPPTFVKPVGNTENPPTSIPSPHTSSTVASHIPSATVLNSVHSEEKTPPLTESAAAWIGQGLGNLHLNPMYNLAMQGQPLGFPVVNGGLMGIHQPMQPMAATSTTYQTLLPSPHTTAAMAEPIGHPHIAYQQPQATLTNRVNDY